MDFGHSTADGESLVPMEGAYHIGAGVDRIEIGAAVFNYDQIDLRVRFYLEGVDKNPAIIRQSDLRTISYSNIPHGSYTLKLQLLNSSLEVTQEISCPVIKEARMWENSYYHIYLLVVMSWLIVFGTWVMLSLRQISCRKWELEVMSQRLEERVREQTSQIVEQADKLAAMQQHTIEGMSTLIESRDGSTGAHVRNTGVYVRMLAERMFLSGMYPEEIDENFADMNGRMAPSMTWVRSGCLT